MNDSFTVEFAETIGFGSLSKERLLFLNHSEFLEQWGRSLACVPSLTANAIAATPNVMPVNRNVNAAISIVMGVNRNVSGTKLNEIAAISTAINQHLNEVTATSTVSSDSRTVVRNLA